MPLKTITSEEFIDYYYKELIGNDKTLAEKIGIEKWVFEPGLPANCPKFNSTRFDAVDTALEQWIKGKPASSLTTKTGVRTNGFTLFVICQIV